MGGILVVGKQPHPRVHGHPCIDLFVPSSNDIPSYSSICVPSFPKSDSSNSAIPSSPASPKTEQCPLHRHKAPLIGGEGKSLAPSPHPPKLMNSIFRTRGQEGFSCHIQMHESIHAAFLPSTLLSVHQFLLLAQKRQSSLRIH